MRHNYILDNKLLNIRLVSAKDALNSSLAAESLKQLYHGLSPHKTEIIDIASIAAESIFDGETKLFNNIDEVLDTLSSTQLYSFYDAYRTVENETGGTLIKNDTIEGSFPKPSSQTVYKNNVFYEFTSAPPTLSLQEISEILQIESLRRFRNTGGDLIDR